MAKQPKQKPGAPLKPGQGGGSLKPTPQGSPGKVPRVPVKK